MECRRFEINIMSAMDLENVRKLCKMKVYARVSIGNQPDSEKRTPVDRHGKTNPAWNFGIKYTISECVVQHYSSMLVIKLYCKRKLGDKYIGEVNLCIKELYEYACPFGGSAIVNHNVQKGCVNSQGLVKFCYRFGEKVGIDKLLLAQSVGVWSF